MVEPYTRGMTRAVIASVVLGALVGCYRPQPEEACTVACTFQLGGSGLANASCPSGLTCGADNRCYADTPCDQIGIDAPAPDGGGPDAPTCPVTFPLIGPLCPTITTPQRSFLNSETINTDTDSRCAAGIATWCVIEAGAILIEGSLRATGTRPLVLYAEANLMLDGGGSIDVAGGGAGSVPACASPPGTSVAAGQSAGGGPGGSFGGYGGNGGALNILPVASPAPILMPMFRGGCAGGAGGAGASNNSPGGAGGTAGGAVYLASAGIISIFGKVTAAGGGGRGASGVSATSPAGGGGGSGGMIVVYGREVHLAASAVLLAHGGGGGAGASGTENGTDGATPMLASPSQPATGGLAPGTAGDGGAGSGGVTYGTPGSDATSGAGGSGGGGGGAGYIVVGALMTLELSTATIEPARTGQ